MLADDEDLWVLPLDRLEPKGLLKLYEEGHQVLVADLFALELRSVSRPVVPEDLDILTELLERVVRVAEVVLELLDQHKHEEV